MSYNCSGRCRNRCVELDGPISEAEADAEPPADERRPPKPSKRVYKDSSNPFGYD
jgi:hypothetical protein